jgi:hypothetical protein
MDKKQREELIPELEALTIKANELKLEFDNLVEHYQIHQDKSPEGQKIYTACNATYTLYSWLVAASDGLKKLGSGYIRDTVTGWYRLLHYDMSDPLVEIAEEDIEDPEYESITYQGNDRWEVIMQTVTHGRERVIVDSDGATWQQVYSADKI